MGKSQKYYVVWEGKVPGVYKTWTECQKQTHGHKGAKFKSYTSLDEAEAAFMDPEYKPQGEYIKESLSVDAACADNPGVMEYQAVHTNTGEKLFHGGPYPKGTNNIGEFLGLVGSLRYLKEKNSDMPIYTDSNTAIAWVRNKKIKTSLEEDDSTAELWSDIREALEWLEVNEYSTKIYKWETHLWGESKADFGRK